MPALRGWILEAFEQARRAGTGPVREVHDLRAGKHTQLPEGIAVWRERMTVDVEAQHLPLHPLFRRVGEGQMLDAPLLPHRPPARRVPERDLRLPGGPTLLRQRRGLAEQPRTIESSGQRVEEPSPDEVLQRTSFDSRPPVEVGDGGERLFVPFGEDGGDGLLRESFAVEEAGPERRAVFLDGEIFFREMDVGWQDPDPDPAGLVEEHPRAVEAHRLGVE